jgi:SAM-dependent methyltransferase
MQKSQITHLFCWVPALWSAAKSQTRNGAGPADPGAKSAELRSEVSKLYGRVATEPNGEFHFHRGAAYASTLLRYDPAALAAIPRLSTDSFAGVGNPHAIDPIRPGEVVLDVGSGSGTDLLLAAHQVGTNGRAIGVEMTDEMFQRCQASIAQSGLSQVEVRRGDAENLPVDDASVDTVISNGVLNLVPDKERALREIYRVLRPGGRLLLSDIALTSGLSRLLRSSVDLWALCVGGALREEEVAGLVEGVGFQQVRTTDRFDCIRGTSSEFLARRLGVHGMNLYARKPQSIDSPSETPLLTT